MSHKYGVGARVVTHVNKEAKVLAILPPREGSDVPRYLVKTDLGEAVWGQDILK